MYLEEFCKFLKIRNYQDDTLRQYKNRLTVLADLLSARQVSLDEAESIDIYNLMLEDMAHLAPATVRANLSALKVYYEYLILTERRRSQPVLSLMYPRVKARPYTYITEPHFLSFQRYIDRKSCLPYKIAVDLMYYCGLRVSETFSVNPLLDIFAWENGKYIQVHGKGAKQRAVPLEEPRLLKNIALFNRVFSDSFAPALATYRETITYHLNRWKTAENMPHYSPHDFRRAFAQRKMEEYGDINRVRELMGHESVNTTLKYIDKTYNTIVAPHLRRPI